MELSISTNSSVALFVIKGKIGWENSRILDKQIVKAIDRGCTYIVFNLDDVTFLCSGGIGALIYNMRKVQQKEGDIYIVSNSDYIQYLFATIGFNVVFNGKIFGTFAEFSEKVLQSKGLFLNPLLEESDLIHTDDRPQVQAKAASIR